MQLNHFHRTYIFCLNEQSHEICGIRVYIALLHLVFATSFQIIHYFRCKCTIYVTVDVLTWFTSWELPPIMGVHQKQKSITKEVQCNIRLLGTQCTWFFLPTRVIWNIFRYYVFTNFGPYDMIFLIFKYCLHIFRKESMLLSFGLWLHNTKLADIEF